MPHASTHILSVYFVFLTPHIIFIILYCNNTTHQHKRLLKHAKGYRGKSKNCFTVAIRRVEKAWQYAYRDRKVKKREIRRLWIQRLSAASRQYGMRYSRLIAHLRYCNMSLNRKVLSELAAMEPFAFKSVMDVIQAERELYLKGQGAAAQQQPAEGDDDEMASPMAA